MYKIVKRAILLSFLTSLLAVHGSQKAIAQIVTSPSEGSYVPGELLVKYKSDSNFLSAEYYRKQIGITTLKTFERIGVRHIKLPEGMKVHEAINTFQNDPNVEYAELNYYYYYDAFPNDPSFDRQWGLHNTGQEINGTVGIADADIDAPMAWDIIKGSTDVVVAVIDSGVDYNHHDLVSNIWTNAGEIPGNGIDDDGNGYVDDFQGWDFFDNDNDPIDPTGHGTSVASIIGAVGNNGIGISGINWNTKIMVLKAGNESGLTLAAIIGAIEYASSFGAHVINCSLTSDERHQSLKDTIDETSSAVFVCAAGNGSSNNDVTPYFPASFESAHIIAVAATNQFDNIHAESNYGATSVDVGAPGVNIYSCYLGNEYRYRTGTSFAAPSVSGIAVLLKAQYPLLTNIRVKEIIEASVDPIGALNGLIATGGRVNAYNALSSYPKPPTAVAGGGGGGGG
jgi:subtilisin family serine protease